MDPVTTNVAGILTIIALWSVLTWVATYMYMSKKLHDKNGIIKFLDEYIEQDQAFINDLRKGIELRDEDIQYYFNMVLELEDEIAKRLDKPVDYYPTGK